MRDSLRSHLAASLEDTRSRNLYRRRRRIEGAHGTTVVADGRHRVNFCSNDYLGLAAHPAVSRALADAGGRLGTGSGASQLITGHNAEHAALEDELAAAVGCERALLFSTGYTANMGTVQALVGRDDTIVADALNHASLIDGARLSGAAKRIYPHADAEAARAALRECPQGHRLLLSDSVFSMDGDEAPLAALSRAAAAGDGWLMVDDAHGFGVLGAGRGGPHAAGVQPDVYVATLGKSVGAAGAFVAGDAALIEYLIQRARTLIFSTAPPPAVAAAARAGLRLAFDEDWRRTHLFGLIRRFRDGARALGLPLLESATPIQPLVLGTETAALAASEALLAHGCLVSAIRPPTVPAGTSRLRITLTAGHTEGQVDALLDGLAQTLGSAPAAATAAS